MLTNFIYHISAEISSTPFDKLSTEFSLGHLENIFNMYSKPSLTSCELSYTNELNFSTEINEVRSPLICWFVLPFEDGRPVNVNSINLKP